MECEIPSAEPLTSSGLSEDSLLLNLALARLLLDIPQEFADQISTFATSVIADGQPLPLWLVERVLTLEQQRDVVSLMAHLRPDGVEPSRANIYL